jgi:hypothetical protein
MTYFTVYVTIVFIIKILFIILAISNAYVKHKTPHNKKLIQELTFWKDRVDFVFTALMALMLIYVFNPRVNNLYLLTGKETKILFYLFGFILLITAKWSLFFKESPLFKQIQDKLH